MRLAVPLALIASACGNDSTEPLSCPFGDLAAPTQLEIVHIANDQIISTTEDDVLPMVIPPQGGWAVLLGARVTNIDGCRMNIATSFRDACSPEVLKFDMRPSQRLEDLGDGWGRVPLADFSNLQMCPVANPMRNLHGESFIFTVTVSDDDGKSASQEIRLSSECPTDDPRCQCECDKNHVVGEACPTLNTDPGPSC